MTTTEIVKQFSSADSVKEIWTSARQLMANRLLAEFVDAPIFLEGFDRLRQFISAAPELDRLLAIDLLVRLPAASKKLTNRAEAQLSNSLEYEIPPLSVLNDSSQLPKQAKPADIRENIALALSYARGEWVRDYLLTSIVNEQQSQRTREVLLKELFTRSNFFGNLIYDLMHTFEKENKHVDDWKNSHVALTSICLSMTAIISQNRRIIEFESSSPKALDAFARSMIKYSGKGSLPPKLEESAIALVRLLDEILTSEISMFVESESYRVIERIGRWWNLRNYPPALRSALQPIVSKLVGAIAVRARMGQKSQELITCLRRAVQDPKQVVQMRNDIAEGEKLAPDVEDWLRGKERRNIGRQRAWRRALGRVGHDETDQLVGQLLIYSTSLREALEHNKGEEVTNAAIGIASRVRSAALSRRLSLEGKLGTIVDYSETAHETVDSETPLGHRVKLESPMVVRIREDGTQDVVVKAIVSELREKQGKLEN